MRLVTEKLSGYLDPAYADGLTTIMDSVDASRDADFRIAFDPTLVRGMSYYTGPIFEISMDEYGGSVGGGGRYDEMIGKFTGQDVPACGFSIGFERIVMLLLERNYQIPGISRKKEMCIRDRKNIAGNFENVGYAKVDKAGIYNILIMEEKQTIMAAGSGASTKFVFQQGTRIERVENVKDLKNYVERIDEMLERKRKGMELYGI